MKPSSVVVFEVLKDEMKALTIPRLHRLVVNRAGIISQQSVRGAIARLLRAGLVKECGFDHSTHPPAKAYCLTDEALRLSPEEVQNKLVRRLPRLPALSDEDLEAIRKIVREELWAVKNSGIPYND